MARRVGTVARGIRAPLIKTGDDIVSVVVDSIKRACKEEGFSLRDKDVIGITESLVARAQGNYATIHDVANDLSRKMKADEIAVLFPILSRNRFFLILKGIIATGKTVHLFLNYPNDEVGNPLMNREVMYEKGINPYVDTLEEKDYRSIKGLSLRHPFTNVDYVDLYKSVAPEGKMHIYFSNDPKIALKYSKEILVANIHERDWTKKIAKQAGASVVLGLDDLLTEPVNGSGYNPEYGLLGSNTASEDRLKLFPRNSQEICEKIQSLIKDTCQVEVEVMVYGDGAFKDPKTGIWEFADPVVSPGFTKGLIGTPREIKLKYVVDKELEAQEGSIDEVIKDRILKKKASNLDATETLGTTPRMYTNLIGSLCDLVSGSGDKGTPIVHVQGYFDDYTSEW